MGHLYRGSSADSTVGPEVVKGTVATAGAPGRRASTLQECNFELQLLPMWPVGICGFVSRETARNDLTGQGVAANMWTLTAGATA